MNAKNEDDIFFLQSAYLNAAYHDVRIQIHRPFVGRRSASPSTFPSDVICTNAARAGSRIVDIAQQRFPTTSLPFFDVGRPLSSDLDMPSLMYSATGLLFRSIPFTSAVGGEMQFWKCRVFHPFREWERMSLDVLALLWSLRGALATERQN